MDRVKSDLRAAEAPKTVQIRKRLQTTSRRGEGRARVGGLGAGQGCRWGAHGEGRPEAPRRGWGRPGVKAGWGARGPAQGVWQGSRGAPGSSPSTVTLPSLDPQGVHTSLPGEGAESLRGESPRPPPVLLGIIARVGTGHSRSAALCFSPLRQLPAPRSGTLTRGRGRRPRGLPD